MSHVQQYTDGYSRGFADYASGNGWALKPYEGPPRHLSIHFIDGYRCGFLAAQNQE